MNPKFVKYGLMMLALVVAFYAGDGIMKAYLETTPAVKEAKAVESLERPGFVLPDLDGNMQNMDQWDGRVVVLNFWATWCPPCRKEMPAFLELQEQYAAKGLQFVGVALDEPGKVEDFVDTMGVDYPILFGEDEAVRVSGSYGNRLGALPYTAVIGRDKKIIKTYRGEVTKNSLEKVIKRAL